MRITLFMSVGFHSHITNIDLFARKDFLQCKSVRNKQKNSLSVFMFFLQKVKEEFYKLCKL